MRMLRLLRRIFWDPTPHHLPSPEWPELPDPPYEGLPIALDLAKQAVDHQGGTADALDTKAGFVLASASLLVAVLTAWHAPSMRIHCAWGICRESLVPHAWIELVAYVLAWILLFAALIVYGFVIYFAGRAYSLRDFNNPPRPAQFVAPYSVPNADHPSYPLLLPEGILQLSLLHSMIDVHAYNAQLIEEKVQWLRRALITFWIEASIVGLVLIYETVIANHMG